MLAMNSDLYFDETASWPAFSSTQALGLLDLAGSSAPPRCSARRAAWPAGRGPRWTRAAPPAGSGAPRPGDWDCLSSVSVSAAASIVLRTMPMLSVIESRNAWWVTLNGENEASSMTARIDPSNRTGQDDDVERRGLAEPRVDPHVVAGDVGEQDPLLLLGALADEALAEPERRREVLALLVAVAGLQLEHRLAAVRRAGHRVEDAVLGRDERARARRGSCSTRR